MVPSVLNDSHFSEAPQLTDAKIPGVTSHNDSAGASEDRRHGERTR